MSFKKPSLGFGCASLMKLARSKDRKNLLAAAYDVGIRHFDVAPMYGFGEVESEVGQFFINKRDELIIATKFGISPKKSIKKFKFFLPIAREFLNKFPAIKKKLARTVEKQLFEKNIFDSERAQISLCSSLKKLKTDFINIFLFHEPNFGDFFSPDLNGWCENLKMTGIIKEYGLGGKISNILPVISIHPWLNKTIQIDNDAIKQQISTLKFKPDSPFITYGALSGAYYEINNFLKRNHTAKKNWTKETGFDFSQEQTLAHFLFEYALSSNTNGTVLFSTTKIKNLLTIAQWVEERIVPTEVLTKFLELVRQVFYDRTFLNVK